MWSVMRKAMTIVAMLLAAAASAVPATAQESGGEGQGGHEQQAALPPSAAVKLAMQAVPGAKPLGVKLSTEGVETIHPVGSMTAYEKGALEAMKPELVASIEKGVAFARGE